MFESAVILKKYGFTLDKKSKFYSGTVLSSKHAFCVFQSPKVIELIRTEIKKKTTTISDRWDIFDCGKAILAIPHDVCSVQTKGKCF